MPLNCEIRRNDKVRKDLVWDVVTLNVMLTVGLMEGDPDFFELLFKTRELEPPRHGNIADTGVYYLDTKAPLWEIGKHVVQNDYLYEIPAANGEGIFATIEIKKGDILRMWRT